MEYKSNEIKAGIMVFISFVVLVLFLVAIFGIDFGKETNEYWIYLKYVGGIKKGSHVKYMGLDVGQVAEINLPSGNENRVKLKLEINKGTPIKTDSRAFLTAIGLMADHHIEVNPGSPEAALLPSGSTINTKEVLNFAQMTETLGDLNTRVQTLLTRVNEIFSSENRANISAMIGNMDKLILEIREPLLQSITNLNKSSNQLAELMEKNEGNLSEVFGNLKTTTQATNQLISKIHTTVENLESLMSSNNSNVIEIVENFQTTSQNLMEFSRLLKEQPWLLVRKSAPPERDF